MDRFVERLVGEVLQRFDHDRTRLMDMLWEVQRARGHISEDAIAALAKGLNMSVPDVGETVTFYHFFRTKPFAQHVIYLADTVIARMKGYDEVRAALIEATGAESGDVIRGAVPIYTCQQGDSVDLGGRVSSPVYFHS